MKKKPHTRTKEIIRGAGWNERGERWTISVSPSFRCLARLDSIPFFRCLARLLDGYQIGKEQFDSLKK